MTKKKKPSPGYRYPIEDRPAEANIAENDRISLTDAGEILGVTRECVRQKTVKGVLPYGKGVREVYTSKKATVALKAEYARKAK